MLLLETIFLSPLGILAVSVAVVIGAIAGLRLPPFLALMLAAVVVGLMSAMNGTEPHRFLKAIEKVMSESGVAIGRLGFTIAMAAVIGMCLLESGAADKIIRRMIATFGPNRAGAALLVSAFLLGAPVFVDTVMVLLLPLARALSLRTGKNLLLYALVICGGAAISNGTVPPAPGPLYVAETLKLELGVVIVAGFVFGIVPLTATLLGARWLDRRRHVPVRPVTGSSLESLAEIAARPESELPPFWVSVSPVLVPMALIATASFANLLKSHVAPHLLLVLEFFGNKNIALGIGGTIAFVIYARQRKVGLRSAAKVLNAPLETAGVIILIIAAGGAYGAMIQNAGIGEAVRGLAEGHAINYVLLAWIIAAVLRAAQGSATVATITALSIVLSIAGPGGFGVHPLYILLAVGFGSKFLAWMNDSGFWVLCRLGGFTQEETLANWTPLVSAVSVVGLIEVLVVSYFFPHLPI